ncbi:MAG: hypothetical protein JXQ87_17410 [Bacteroidia bacterium]
MQQITIKNPGISIIECLIDLENTLSLHSFSDPKHHGFEFLNSKGLKVLKIQIPLYLGVPEANVNLKNYAQQFRNEGDTFCLALIRAGESAMGLIKGTELLEYKVIRKYMVRKKQGKSQLKHLHSKGKSRAGSRIRLAQSQKFFEEINLKLQLWQNFIHDGLFVYGVAASLLPFWTASNVKLPVDLKSPKQTRKVNWTVGLPREKELERSIKYLYSARISIFDTQITEVVKSKLEQYLYIYSQNP